MEAGVLGSFASYHPAMETAEIRRRSMQHPVSGVVDGRSALVFDLEQPRFKGMPIHDSHQPGYFYSLHRRHSDAIRNGVKGARTGSSGVIVAMEHSGTH